MEANDKRYKKLSRSIWRHSEKTVFYPLIFTAYNAVSTESAGLSWNPVLYVFLCQGVIPADKPASPACIALRSDSDAEGGKPAEPVGQQANRAVGDAVSHHS